MIVFDDFAPELHFVRGLLAPDKSTRAKGAIYADLIIRKKSDILRDFLKEYPGDIIRARVVETATKHEAPLSMYILWQAGSRRKDQIIILIIDIFGKWDFHPHRIRITVDHMESSRENFQDDVHTPVPDESGILAAWFVENRNAAKFHFLMDRMVECHNDVVGDAKGLDRLQAFVQHSLKARLENTSITVCFSETCSHNSRSSTLSEFIPKDFQVLHV